MRFWFLNFVHSDLEDPNYFTRNRTQWTTWTIWWEIQSSSLFSKSFFHKISTQVFSIWVFWAKVPIKIYSKMKFSLINFSSQWLLRWIFYILYFCCLAFGDDWGPDVKVRARRSSVLLNLQSIAYRYLSG